MGCKLMKSVIAIVIAVLAIWPSLIGYSTSKWLIFVGAIVLLVHDWCCRKCSMCCGACGGSCDAEMSRPSKKRKK
ncbi:MAG: hypothetical protein AABX66_00180 [Nanoarchaeota archaeon]